MKTIFMKLIFILGSTWLMVILFVALAFGMGVGTFIENAHSIDAARIYVYNSWWFETLMGLFVINFFLNIKKFGLHLKHKWPTLTIHLALVVIIIGAFITRYHGFTGLISIREGATSDKILSDDAFLEVEIEASKGTRTLKQHIEKRQLLSSATPRLNTFSIKTVFDNRDITISYKDFVKNAQWSFRKEPQGALFLKIVETKQGERHDHFIKENELFHCGDISYSLNGPVDGAYNFLTLREESLLEPPLTGSLLEMATGREAEIVAGQRDTVKTKALYDFGKVKFVVPEPPSRGALVLTSGTPSGEMDGSDGLILTVASDTIQREVVVLGKKRKIGERTTAEINGLTYTFTYGSKVHKLPFQLQLDDFIAERYPGTTNSYSAFESKVEVLDGQKKQSAEIYMNHVLDYRGYRFFQSSFHPDEKGTILSVNHDFLGTIVTYIGYFLLYFGLLAILFTKKSRFGQVIRKLKRLNATTKWAGTIILFLISCQGYGQSDIDPMDSMVQKKLDSILLHYKVPESHAAKFGRLVIQDANGRMKPMDTYASEVLRKVSKDYSYKELNANQTILSMAQFPELWFNVPLIYIKRGNDSLRNLLEISREAKLAPLSKFFDKEGEYKIKDQVTLAYKSMVPNQFEKDFIEVDRRVNLLYNTLGGEGLRLFPIPNESNNTWTSNRRLAGLGFQKKDSLFVAGILPLYFNTFSKEIPTGNFQESLRLLEQIEKYQSKFGHEVIPNASKIDLEILYNEYDVFKNLFSWYLSFGLLLLIAAILYLFKGKGTFANILWIPRVGIYLCFAAQTLGLLARWYISGHAPWSDAYESIIYISWATMLFGIVIGRKFDLALAATAFVNAMILMVAHWNWLDPAIANLQPVLNSYWLMIHVAIIVASYGPFTLGMILSALSLLFMALLNKRNHGNLRLAIKKLTLLTEITLTIGLVMLTIGNFLGGQWANESWGRYWAWDPKETWALVSIMVYALIIHMRLVPKLNNTWLFSIMGVLGFYAILMTYFGVNFYLSGLHSYAQGDNIVTPGFIYYSIGAVGILAGISYFKRKRYPV
ncbi:cytochrome c biogenesis protein CcsA [Allomuricauda sp. CP2A]|jgi:cytochrome c-type biogenesis protein CcsB|uniref:cytochrome c biogenesis protein CcsA n=1 Tax=Allomuricauda sp. CP2A TaxID=1848189 RepID=UPI0009F735EC|nr:cytochrome c biogenesis protein CcsA [Muricauda sp. CP2A]